MRELIIEYYDNRNEDSHYKRGVFASYFLMEQALKDIVSKLEADPNQERVSENTFFERRMEIYTNIIIIGPDVMPLDSNPETGQLIKD